MMCGRYTLSNSIVVLAEHFHAAPSRELLTPTDNAAPSQTLPTIFNTTPNKIALGFWGFVPEWADRCADVKPLINARAETVATKPFLRDAFKHKRCLVFA